jgi:lysine 6-dehydrogenase
MRYAREPEQDSETLIADHKSGMRGVGMGYRYAIVGTGRQGIASAYDFGKFGEAEEIVLIDIHPAVAEEAASKINALLGRDVARAVQGDASDTAAMERILGGVDSFMSGVHFPLNPGLTGLAIDLGANMCDLGGNTDVVRQQINLDADARKAGITVVPDCGMGPGLNVSLAVRAMELLDEPREVLIWDGGLPADPRPPWNYAMTFNIEGLTNEYCGNAYFLRGGKVTEVPALSGLETVAFAEPIGNLEAFVTSGGLSTSPWTFEGRLERLENKTLRYPGHAAMLQAFCELGLFGLEPVEVGGARVVPRDVLHALLGPQITAPDVRDICIMRVRSRGRKGGRDATATIELIDRYDESTGFSAMQRLTGWHASIIAILAARGQVEKGVVPVELAVPGHRIVEEARLRGFHIKECVAQGG